MQVTMLVSLWRYTAVLISLRQLLYRYISLQTVDFCLGLVSSFKERAVDRSSQQES